MVATDWWAKLMLRCLARVVRWAAVAVAMPLRMWDTACIAIAVMRDDA
jgi:hypothetical protein